MATSGGDPNGRGTPTGARRASPAVLGGGLGVVVIGLVILLLGSSGIGVVLIIVGVAVSVLGLVPRVWDRDQQRPGG